MTRESRGEGIFPFLINDRRADSESDAFLICSTTIRWGRKTFSYSFSFSSAFVGSFLALYFWKKRSVSRSTPILPPPSQSLLSIPAKPLAVLKIASHSWLTVDQHPHIGTRECMGLLYLLKVLVWWAHTMSLTSWLPALAEFVSWKKIYTSQTFVCL